MITYQFRDVEDILSEENCHAHFDRPLLLFIGSQVVSLRVGQELETCFVEILLIFLSAVVCSKILGQGSNHLGVDV